MFSISSAMLFPSTCLIRYHIAQHNRRMNSTNINATNSKFNRANKQMTAIIIWLVNQFSAKTVFGQFYFRPKTIFCAKVIISVKKYFLCKNDCFGLIFYVKDFFKIGNPE